MLKIDLVDKQWSSASLQDGSSEMTKWIVFLNYGFSLLRHIWADFHNASSKKGYRIFTITNGWIHYRRVDSSEGCRAVGNKRQVLFLNRGDSSLRDDTSFRRSVPRTAILKTVGVTKKVSSRKNHSWRHRAKDYRYFYTDDTVSYSYREQSYCTRIYRHLTTMNKQVVLICLTPFLSAIKKVRNTTLIYGCSRNLHSTKSMPYASQTHTGCPVIWEATKFFFSFFFVFKNFENLSDSRDPKEILQLCCTFWEITFLLQYHRSVYYDFLCFTDSCLMVQKNHETQIGNTARRDVVIFSSPIWMLKIYDE